jgi:predicted metal-dependent HD superfamily phosphohydrolase
VSTVERFLATLPPGADPAAAARIATALRARWSEPHRHYHTLQHLDAVLDILDANARLADDPDAVRLAAWYHDAVYDPTASTGDNEEASAALATADLTALGLPADRVTEVARLIRLTRDHRADPRDPDGCLLADADLAILAAEPAAYDAYAAAVRREYAHVPEPLYRAGRAVVLDQLRAMPRLYQAVPAAREWTASAHANLDRELIALRG